MKGLATKAHPVDEGSRVELVRVVSSNKRPLPSSLVRRLAPLQQGVYRETRAINTKAVCVSCDTSPVQMNEPRQTDKDTNRYIAPSPSSTPCMLGAETIRKAIPVGTTALSAYTLHVTLKDLFNPLYASPRTQVHTRERERRFCYILCAFHIRDPHISLVSLHPADRPRKRINHNESATREQGAAARCSCVAAP